MIRKLIRSTLFAGLGMLAVVMSLGAAAGAGEQKEDAPDISTVMKKSFGKTDGYIARIKLAAKDGKWEDASKDAKSLVALSDALPKHKAPKGDPKSWESLTKKFHTNTVAVEKAVIAKDAKGVDTSIGTIQKSCGECHKAHR